MAALRAAQLGAKVLLIDRLPRAGKKILATGGGRCNISNRVLRAENYNNRASNLVAECLEQVDAQKIITLFESMGVFLREEEGKLYPVTNQAATVLTALETACDLAGVQLLPETAIQEVISTNDGFILQSHDGRIRCQKLILATGGRTYPALGSDGSGYTIAQSLGHSIIEPIPTCVPVVCKHPLCHPCQGLKMLAEVTVPGAEGLVSVTRGDMLFTKYGLSGTAVLDASDAICEALHRNNQTEVWLEVDFAPFLTRQELIEELKRREHWPESPTLRMNGILPAKLAAALADQLYGRSWVDAIKRSRFCITDTRGWNEAEFTNGGVRCQEVKADDLSSTRCAGLFLAGEVLDVHGQRGGYNLAWAWISGYIAGESSVKSSRNTGIM